MKPSYGNCECCGVLKDEKGNACCPYCQGALIKNYPSGRKCIDCECTFVGCKCETGDGCGGCSGGGCGI